MQADRPDLHNPNLVLLTQQDIPRRYRGMCWAVMLSVLCEDLRLLSPAAVLRIARLVAREVER